LGSQQDARNIEKGFMPCQKNVHFLGEEPEQHNTFTGPHKQKLWQNTRKPLKPRASSRKSL